MEYIEQRKNEIIRISIIGILTNVLLAATKAAIGFVSGSIAIVLDAVNNLSDALSSVITIIGTRLAAKPADREHPFGHGRIEYITASFISLIVLYAGITSLIESVKGILTPQEATYSVLNLSIIGIAVIAKLFLGFFFTKNGRRIHSDSLAASGKDALFDSFVSLSTILAAIIYLTFHISLEAFLGILISGIIIKSGIDMIRENLRNIIGVRSDDDIAKEIKQSILRHTEVSGVYDLVLHSYGPDIYTGSLHIEVDETMSAKHIYEISREISAEIYEQYNIVLEAVGIYPRNTVDDIAISMKATIENIAHNIEYIVEVHGLYIDKLHKIIHMDLVIDFAAPDRDIVMGRFYNIIKGLYPDYEILIVMDKDISG